MATRAPIRIAAKAVLGGLLVLAVGCQDQQPDQSDMTLDGAQATTASGVTTTMFGIERGSYGSLYAKALEGAELKAACMQELGWFAEVVPGPGVMYHYGDESNMEAADEAFAECSAQYSAYEIDYRPTRREEYEWNVSLAECLRAQGYAVRAAPTFDAWEDSYERGPWTAYEAIEVSDNVLPELYKACPPF